MRGFLNGHQNDITSLRHYLAFMNYSIHTVLFRALLGFCDLFVGFFSPFYKSFRKGPMFASQILRIRKGTMIPKQQSWMLSQLEV